MRALLLLVLLAIVLGSAFTVHADPQSNVTVQAQGGNVTQLLIEGQADSDSWSGFYGNISANKNLDDAVNNSFYTWGNATPSGEVYASRNASVVWTSVNCTNATERTAEETYLGQVASDAESVTNTFNRTNHPELLVGVETIDPSTCFSTNVNVNGTAQNETFYQVLLSDNASNIVYTTIINEDEYGFNGELMDFQIMVGENEQVGNEGVTTYYLFVELD